MQCDVVKSENGPIHFFPCEIRNKFSIFLRDPFSPAWPRRCVALVEDAGNISLHVIVEELFITDVTKPGK